MSSVEKSGALALDIIEAKSPANQYLVRLLEERGAVSFRPPTEERVQLVFKVLDSLIPQLGVYCRVLGLIREELHGAVYSQDTPGAQHQAQSPGISSVPYFSLVCQMQSERNEDVDAVRAELQSANATLSVRDEELQCLREKICNIQEMNQTLQDAITTLQIEAEENQKKCKQLEKEIALKAALLETERQSHKLSLSNLHEQLQASSMKIQEMTQLTQDYQALQNVFQSPLTRKKQNMLSAVGKVPSDRTASNSTHISTYLQATGHMYEQLLQVQNRVLDDFDHYLENCTRVSDPGLSHPPRNKEMRTTFLSRLAEISEELLLLEQHREGLEQRNARAREVSSRTQSLENMESLRAVHTESQEKVEERNTENIEWFLSQALYPDETLLNRYAVMIYTSSDNGRIFEELEGATVCDSCGQKTILCPHKVRRSQEICLPGNCTHIKICRPQAHVSTLEAKIAQSRMMSLVPPTKGAVQISDKIIEDFPTKSSVVISASDRSLDTRFCRFEEDLEKKVQQRRVAPRMLSQKLCVSLAQQLFLTMVLQLEGKSPSLPIQETVRQFFNERYVNRDISAYGLVDFWTALRRDTSASKVLGLLRSVLEEDMDPAILYYVLLRAETVISSPLSDLDHFKQYIHKLYPFLEENEQDGLLLEFTGYSRRCVSPSAVMGFILHLILQHQEPLIRECEDVLSTYVKTRSRHLTPVELSEALTELCPFLNRAQIELSIQRSMAASGRDFIPLHSAAQIAAFQMEREKHQGNKAAVHIYGEENRRSGNKSSRSEDLHDFQLLHNLLHQLKCQNPNQNQPR